MEPKQKYPVVDVTGAEVKSNAVENNIAQEPEMLGPRIKVNWNRSNRRWSK